MVNQCNFIGNLGRDPEIKTFPSGGKIANFSIAVTEKWKDKKTGEPKSHTEWINVSATSEGLVRVIEAYVKKGSKLYISGKLKTRSWEGKDGSKKYATEVVLGGFDSKLMMLDSKGDVNQHSVDKGNAFKQEDELDDSIPF